MHAYPFVCVYACLCMFCGGNMIKCVIKENVSLAERTFLFQREKKENFILLQTYSNLKVCTHWLLLIVGSHIESRDIVPGCFFDFVQRSNMLIRPQFV